MRVILPKLLFNLGLAVALCLAPSLLAPQGQAYAADKSAKQESKRKTKRSQVIGQKVFKVLEQAQVANDAKDYPQALSLLDGLMAKPKRLNSFEKATIYNFYAVIYYQTEQLDKAKKAYKNVLKQKDIPEGLRNNSLFSLAQLLFVTEDYPTSIRVLQKWYGLVENVKPDAYMLEAQAHYQLGDYQAAEKPILKALGAAKKRKQRPKENWLGLLRAVYYELNNYERAAKVLEVMVRLYPKKVYWTQLAGMYGLQGRQKDQLATMHAANEAGYLDKESELVNMARLYLAEQAPYGAVRVMKAGLESQKIEDSVQNLQLYAQALSLAQEYEAQLPVLEKAAEKSGEGKHYVYLGQAQAALGRWKSAASAYQQALQIGELEREGSVLMQLGMARYNAKQYQAARKAFIKAIEFPKNEKQASNWLKFVEGEIKRQEALAKL